MDFVRARLRERWPRLPAYFATARDDRFLPRSDLVAQQREIPANAWLSWSAAELAEQAIAAQIALEDAFRFTVSGHKLDTQGFEWDEAFGASKPFVDFK